MKQNFQAIVLDKKDVGETDRIYTFYTYEMGLLKTPARGIRKLQAKLPSQVELFNLVNISVAKNRGSGLLVGAILEKAFFDLKKNYVALMEVFRARDIFSQVVCGHEVDQNLFFLFLEYLSLVNEFSKQKNYDERMIWLTNAFIFKLYFSQGYNFSFQRCCKCSKNFSSEELNFFSTLVGGVICSECSKKVKFKSKIDINTIKALRLLIKNTLTNLAKVSVDDKLNNQMSVMTKDILNWILR